MIIGKIDGTRNPANTLTRDLATASAMLEPLEGLGVIDSFDKGVEEHVQRTKLRVVTSVEFKKWKPLVTSITTLRQHNGALLRRRRMLPPQWQETPQ